MKEPRLAQAWRGDVPPVHEGPDRAAARQLAGHAAACSGLDASRPDHDGRALEALEHLGQVHPVADRDGQAHLGGRDRPAHVVALGLVAGQALQLNGAGVRVKVIVDVYAAGLYVGKRDASVQALLSQPGAKSMQIVLLRDLTGEDFADAMIKGFNQNNTEAEVSRFQARLDDPDHGWREADRAVDRAVDHLRRRLEVQQRPLHRRREDRPRRRHRCCGRGRRGDRERETESPDHDEPHRAGTDRQDIGVMRKGDGPDQRLQVETVRDLDQIAELIELEAGVAAAAAQGREFIFVQ